MTISPSSSSDFSLASITKNHKKHIFIPSKTAQVLHFLSPISSTSSRILILNSSSSSYPPPILEDELDMKVQDFQDSEIPESENLNVLIISLLKDSETEETGFKYYQKAKRKADFVPKKTTLHYLIRYLMRLKDWNLVWSVSEDFRKFNVYPDAPSCCKLISGCIKARRFKLANNLLHILKFEKQVAGLSFNAAMKSYNKLHMYSSTVNVFEIMKSAGIQLDAESYGHTMEAYLKMGKNEIVVSLFKEFESSEAEWTSFSTQIYRILCESLGKLGRPFEALDFFREMKSKGFPEDPSFYASLVSSFASIREVKSAEELMEEAKGKKMLRDPAVFLKLVLMYIELGSVEKTLDIVSYMKQMNIRVSDCIFCAIVNAFSRKRGPTSAAKVYEDLVADGCVPGQVTYASVLNVYCRIGLYEKAEGVFLEMENKGFDKCVVAYSSMIAMYGKTNRIRDAMRLVAKMKEKGVEPNVWIYNSLLDMHGKVLNLRQVEKIWKEMKRRKVVPDKVSYTSVISAYSKAREFETCVKYYSEYRLNGGGIDRVMGGIMVGVYSKMSRVDELVKLLQDMKAEGTRLDARLYRSSLNALRDAGVQIQPKWLEESLLDQF
ncbi:pentatricopeptide repeat-containing protein [Tanacetum coccineum]